MLCGKQLCYIRGCLCCNEEVKSIQNIDIILLFCHLTASSTPRVAEPGLRLIGSGSERPDPT